MEQTGGIRHAGQGNGKAERVYMKASKLFGKKNQGEKENGDENQQQKRMQSEIARHWKSERSNGIWETKNKTSNIQIPRGCFEFGLFHLLGRESEHSSTTNM